MKTKLIGHPSRVFRLALVGTLCMLLPSVGEEALASISPQFPWPTTLAETQQSDKLPSLTVQTFLNSLRQAGVPPLQVGEFRFVPLESSHLCLVATVDSSGRNLFFAVAVICRSPRSDSYQMTLLDSAPPHLLGSELVDIDGDGVFEIVTRELAGGYRGAQTLPVYWYSVFRVKGAIPRDESANYKKFYGQRLLPQLQFISRLLASEPAQPGGVAAEARAEGEFLKAKYDRRIGGIPTAGFDKAQPWAESGDPRLQMLAIETFREIGTPAAFVEMEKLRHAKDYVVSQAATNAVNAK